MLTGDKRSATVKAINHLECIEVSKEALKVIIDKNSGSGVVPYLPLSELNQKKAQN